MNVVFKFISVCILLVTITCANSFDDLERKKLGNLRSRRLDESNSWRDRVKEKGESLFAEKKRAAIRAACYKDWKPGCRRIVEWAKKTGRIKGQEQQELLDFARNVIANAEKNGDLIPTGEDQDEPEPPSTNGAK